MTRVAVLGMHHETNTFSTVLADMEAYKAGGIRRGDELVAHYRDSKSTLGGFVETGPGQDDVETVALVDAMVTPRGLVTAEAYDAIVGEMETLLRSEGPFDAVLLGLHGACVAERLLSADVDIAERVRAVVGPEVPIGTVLDMHGNLDPRLAETLDIVLAYQTNPHVDPSDKARECRQLILDIVATGARPAVVIEQLPLVVEITKQDTSMSPVSDLLAIAADVEREPGMLDVSILEGFPYADVPQMGMAVIATHPDRAKAADAARRVASKVWERRVDLQGGAVSVEAAVDTIRRYDGEKPLLVLDVGDNIGGGGPGDSTVLFEAIMAARLGGVAGTLYDPDAVAELAAASVGDRVSVQAGGHSREQDGAPVTVTGTLAGRHFGQYEEPRIAHGGFRFFDGGEMVSVVTDDGFAVVLTSKAVETVTPVQLQVVGLEPASFQAIIAKGVNAPRAGYSAVCGDLLVVDTPGVTRNSLAGFTYQHRRQPIFPFEPATYP